MLPWRLQSFPKTRCFLPSLPEYGCVCSKPVGQRMCRPRCESVKQAGSGKGAFISWLPGWAPTSLTHFTGEGPVPPAPITRASGSRDLALAGLGDYPHSLCLWPGRASLPLLSSHKGQARRACCVRVSVYSHFVVVSNFGTLETKIPGNQIKNGNWVNDLLESVQLPSVLVIMKVLGHSN